METKKNTVEGSNITAEGNVRIGDDIYLPPETKHPKELCLKIPHLHLGDIIGREKDLTDLHNLLCDQKQVVVVNGLGGIGKTTLAQGYLSQYYEEYQHIVWVSQLSDDVTNDFVNTEGLTKCLGIDTQGKEPRDIFTDIIRQLKSLPDHPSLLIIDNADAALSKIHDLLPHQPNWHVLVTSRERIEKFHSKDLSFLSPDHALELFRRHCTRIHDEQQIRELLETVDYHTLTIEILAKTAQLQRYDAARLQKAIADDLKANVYVAHLGDKVEKVFSYLLAIFKLSKLTPDETWLAKQFICLPPVFHKYELLEELINPEVSAKAEVFSETLTALADKGWLLSDGDSDTYKMHRIVVEVAARQIPVELEEVAALVHSVTEKLRIDDTKDNPAHKFPWIPFGKAVLEEVEEKNTTDIALLQIILALVLKDLGDYTEAKSLMEKALQRYEQQFGPDHTETAIVYSNLALRLQDLGDYAGAKTLLEKAVHSDEKNFGTDHPSTARSSSNLALVLKDLGDYGGAKILLEKAVLSDEKNFGTDHPSTAISYSNLAVVLQNLGDYAGAKTLLEKAVHSAEKNFGPDHPFTAISYSNLALVLKDLGDYGGAKSLLEKAVHSDEKNFGSDHPHTAIVYSNLALVLQDLGDYAEALALSGKALAVFKKVLPAGHPHIATVSEIYESIKSQMQP